MVAQEDGMLHRAIVAGTARLADGRVELDVERQPLEGGAPLPPEELGVVGHLEVLVATPARVWVHEHAVVGESPKDEAGRVALDGGRG